MALRITSAGLAVIDAADKAIAASPEESGSGLSSAGEAINLPQADIRFRTDVRSPEASLR